MNLRKKSVHCIGIWHCLTCDDFVAYDLEDVADATVSRRFR
jgi:hypothetical protein